MTALDRVRRALERGGSVSRDGGKTWCCPSHDDHTPSLSVRQGELGALVLCRAGCPTDAVLAALGLARSDLFDHGDAQIERPSTAPAREARVEILGNPTTTQTQALRYSRRVVRAETLSMLGVVAVRWSGSEWLGIPALEGSWKLWALDASGKPRLDEGGRIIRRNAGPVSLVVSPALRETAVRVERLWDVEGESDLFACVDAGLRHVVAGTGGARSLAGHNRQSVWLAGLRPREVCIVRDLDDPGRAGAEKCAAWWRAQGFSTRIGELPGELGKSGDVRDFLNGRPGQDGSPATAPMGDASALERLADRAPLLEPEDASGGGTEGASEPETAEDDDTSALIFPRSALRGTFAGVVDMLQSVTGATEAHVFAATWATVATCIGRSRWGGWSGRVSSPVFALCVGPTGDHKSSAMDRVTELLPESIRRIDGVTSDAGLFDALEEAAGASVLLHFDELGFLLKMAGISGQMLDSMLNRLWGAPKRLEKRLSKRNRDGGARSVERPLVSLIAGTHAETFWRHLEDPDLAIGSGFVNRLAPFCVARGRSLALTREPDEAAAEEIRAHLKRLAVLEPRDVTLAPSAERLWAEYSVEHDRRIGELAHTKAAVVKRVRDHVARLALLLATDVGREVITPSDLLCAIEVGAFIEASYLHLLAGRALGRGPERTVALEDRIRTAMQYAPNRLWSRRDLEHLWNGSARPSADEIRRVLSSMEDVERVGTDPRSRFRLYQFGPRSTHKLRRDAGNSVDRGPAPPAADAIPSGAD